MATAAQPLHDTVATQVRDLIFAGALEPGELLDEKALCDQLEVSRTPLREALKLLVSEGLLRHEPRRGCFVERITDRDLDDIFPVIALLEGRAAFEATHKLSAADRAVLDVMHEQLTHCAQSGDIAGYYRMNHQIHEAFITLADNRWLAQTIADLRRILRLARLQQLSAPGRLAGSLQEHLHIYEAMVAGNADAAEQAMRNHLLQQRKALQRMTTLSLSRIAL
ncbi:DNA-binding GntR family transcriptional regulator [Comamonas odontotermitis]|uniref:DNA-binding GntR family transcriptional regulator n=1 Tax=Comamonas odontotermitis TaxID=379895 RepID=A0ABR6RGA5_9BURK|nr:GntR family transcriptional regulator [Comamonas odontotermitis]MBB6578196.1 DNA-binding GntR family transcriptional regulator [Comamonas odontotermitis]